MILDVPNEGNSMILDVPNEVCGIHKTLRIPTSHSRGTYILLCRCSQGPTSCYGIQNRYSEYLHTIMYIT